MPVLVVATTGSPTGTVALPVFEHWLKVLPVLQAQPRPREHRGGAAGGRGGGKRGTDAVRGIGREVREVAFVVAHSCQWVTTTGTLVDGEQPYYKYGSAATTVIYGKRRAMLH